MEGEREHVFVAGLLAGLGIALRESDPRAQGYEQWQVFLSGLAAVRARTIQGDAAALNELDNVLMEYGPTHDALRNALLGHRSQPIDSAQGEQVTTVRLTGVARNEESPGAPLVEQALSEELRIFDRLGKTMQQADEQSRDNDASNDNS